MSAQGNALGIEHIVFCTLKGCDNQGAELVAPLQGAKIIARIPGRCPGLLCYALSGRKKEEYPQGELRTFNS